MTINQVLLGIAIGLGMVWIDMNFIPGGMY